MKKIELIKLGIETLRKHFKEISISIDLFNENAIYDMDTNEDSFTEYTLDEYIEEVIVPTMEENIEVLDITAEFVREYKRIYEETK